MIQPIYNFDDPLSVVELAKKYGAKESASFVNGVIDKFAKSEIL